MVVSVGGRRRRRRRGVIGEWAFVGRAVGARRRSSRTASGAGREGASARAQRPAKCDVHT